MPAPGPAVLLRIYTEEGRQSGHRPLYEDIVIRARKLGLAGATVLRGPMGFGQSTIIHTAKILEFSGKLPLVVEIVDTEEKIRTLLVEIGGTRGIGLITLEKVEVVRYGASPPT
ncbi:MAG: DUF190 domain-containing protein [Caulobacteraceae bacterium]